MRGKSHTNLENTECQTCAISARLIDGGNKTAEWAPEPGSAAKKVVASLCALTESKYNSPSQGAARVGVMGTSLFLGAFSSDKGITLQGCERSSPSNVELSVVRMSQNMWRKLKLP